MENKLNVKRTGYNWNPVEVELGFGIFKSYKDFYEKYGCVGIDDYIYINNPTECKYNEGLCKFKKYLEEDVYTKLEGYLTDDLKIKFYDGFSGWMPIGYTIDGDFIFCTEDSIIVTDAGFESRDIYKCSLEKFLEMYLTNTLKSKVLGNEMVDGKHDVEIIYKESN